MAILPTSNTGNTKAIDRTAGGSKPDSTPATGTTNTTITGAVTSVNGSIGVGASPTTGNVSVYLNTTGVTANTYGSSTTVPVIAVNAQGQITSATNTSISTLTNPMTTLGDSIYGGTSGTATRLAGNTGSRRQYFSQTGTGSASAAPAWVNGPAYNVNDFGIVAAGAGGTDLTSAINTMLSSVPNGACVYFPSNGNYYRVDGPINVSSKQVHFQGDGSNTTKFITNSTTANILYVTNSNFTMSAIGFKTNVTRTLGYPLINVVSSNDASSLCNYEDIFLDGISGDGMLFTGSCFNLQNSTLQSAANCGVLLHSVASGVTMNSVNIRNSDNTAPAFIMEGTCTSATITNCGFGGGGARYKYTPTSVTSDGTYVTVNLSSTTGFFADDFIVLKNMGSPAYNGFWRITSVTSSAVVAKATPIYAVPASGTATVGSGIAETIPCAVQISNDTGAVNECVMDNCLFGAVGYPYDPLSCSLYLQGSDTAGGTGSVEGWTFSNLYLDYGNVAVIATNGNYVNAMRFNFSNIISVATLGQFLISKVPSVMIVNAQGCNSLKLTNVGAWTSGITANPGQIYSYSGYNYYCKASSSFTSTTPPSSDTTNFQSMGPIPAFSFSVYAYSDSSYKSEALMISNCSLTGNIQWNGIGYSDYTPTYGIVVDGQIQTFVMGNSIVWGKTAPTYNLNSGLTSSTLVGGSGNLYLSGTTNPPTKNTTPTYFP